MAPPSRDYWLGFFRGAGDSIFDAIDAAITVVASEHPGALRQRRDSITERLYTALLVTSTTATRARVAAGAQAPIAGVAHFHPEGAASVPSLPDGSVLTEVERVKTTLLNDQEKDALLELLRRLQQLDLTMDTLEATTIGKTVGKLRKHSSKQIRNLVRSLIEGWKHTVDVYLARCKDAVVGHTPQSMGPSSLEQEDQFMRLSEENLGFKFSNGMHDGGSGQQYPVNNEPVRKPPSTGPQGNPEQSWGQEQSVTKEQFIAEMLARPSNAESDHGRPQARPRPHHNASPPQGRLQSTSSDKPVIHHNENSVRAKLELAKNAKLEAAKRKLQEDCQEHDNAKKQRTVQMVDPQNL